MNKIQIQFSSCYRDGQPYMHRTKPNTSESINKAYLNTNEATNRIVQPLTRERIFSSMPIEPKTFCLLLNEKLEKVKVERDNQERLENVLHEAETADDQPMGTKSFASNVNAGPQQVNHQAITTAILRKISAIDLDNDQDILDQHVSRVFSPLVQSPGTASPRQAAAMTRPPPLPHRTLDSMPEFRK